MVRIAEKRFYCSAGDPVKTIYSPVVKDDGSIEIEPSGKVNTDEEIQSYAQSCDMKVILNRYMNGDTSVLNMKEGMYGDFTKMPKTYAEFLQQQIDAENTFNKLDPKIKEKFDNDLNQFMATAGSEEWMKKLGVFKEKPIDEIVIEKENKE